MQTHTAPAKKNGRQRGSERPSDSHAAPTKKRSMFLMTPAGETTSTQKRENALNCVVQFLILTQYYQNFFISLLTFGQTFKARGARARAAQPYGAFAKTGICKVLYCQ